MALEKEWLQLLTEEVEEAFQTAGYDREFGRVVPSNRPDLCEYQCNGALAAAKKYHKAPIAIAQEVAAVIEGCKDSCFGKAMAQAPGFLNLTVREEKLSACLGEMAEDERCGAAKTKTPKKIVLDYGGPNVAKPLHVGHLRSAVIGESIKRILRYCGEEVIGDIHLGDWGLQMGLVITEVRRRMPDLPYFDEAFEGPWPEEAPFTVSELEEIYPFASARSKEDPEYYREAMEYTHRLQNREKGLFALWQKIVEVSTKDMRRNYERLHVSFELWNGESTVQDRIAPMVQEMKDKGLAVMSDGALIVDVAEESDARTIPPCMILKSDGAALYTTTDLATIVDRMEKIAPDEIIYVTDKRQELHFTQVFRCARKCGLLPESTGLTHIGFGTVNGSNGLALKTREGGVMRLETLIDDIDAAMLEKIRTNPEIPEDEAVQTARQVALAALKYGDLSNQASKDYIFDLDKFISFEGDTGPYILYTIVRMQSILRKYEDGKKNGNEGRILPARSAEEKRLMLTVASFPEAVRQARSELSPTRICAYIYALANDCNSFYHTTKILSEEDETQKAGWIALIRLANRILSTGIELLGFTAPERM